ncbi:hypothetical protein TNCV_160241 [Trichonephila clavipes]|nr:hypothetical protein TNCV_160241 [Trichonephila clavipes]
MSRCYSVGIGDNDDLSTEEHEWDSFCDVPYPTVSLETGVTPIQPRFGTQRLFPVSEIEGTLIQETALFRQCCENTRRDLAQWGLISTKTDSTIAIAWINLPLHQLKTFVAESKIQTLTANYQLKHISSRDNPADLISREANPSDLEHLELWWSRSSSGQ